MVNVFSELPGGVHGYRGRLEAVCKPLQSCAKENLLMCGGSKQVVEILG